MSKKQTPIDIGPTIQRARELLMLLKGDYVDAVLLHLDNSDWDSIIKMPMPDPKLYNSSWEFHQDYVAYNILRKFDAFPVDIDKAAVAIEGFLLSELTCSQANNDLLCLPYVSGFPLASQVTSVLDRARQIAGETLGKFKLSEMLDGCRFTTGASTRLTRKRGDSSYKCTGPIDVTGRLRDCLIAYLWNNHATKTVKGCESFFPQDWVNVVRGGRLDTVPKDSKTDRVIVIEPEGNMLFQTGLGKMIRKRLRRVGVNLNDQGVNQLLAKVAARCGLATIDLSRASDSICWMLVKALLPSDWYEWIMLTRSPEVLLPDGTWHRLEKVSGMGNGFTFELESLLFYCLTVACVELSEKEGPALGTISVYGDDIVVPVVAVPDLIRVFKAVGFEINTTKSYWDGPFRESCGNHYFDGADVTPLYIKEAILGSHRKFWWINSLEAIFDGVADDLRMQCIKRLRAADRIYVPPSFPADAGIRAHSPTGLVRRHRRSNYWIVKYDSKRSKKVYTRRDGYAYVGSWLNHLGGKASELTAARLSQGDITWARKRARVTIWE